MRLALTHIPRTGGTSLFAGVKTQMPTAKAVEIDSYAQVAMMPDRELNSYDVISTYLGSNLFNRLDGSWTKVIVLREPLERLRSSYWHLRTSPHDFSFASERAKKCTFREYLASRDAAVIFQATDTQAWSVLGDKSLHFRRQMADIDPAQVSARAIQNLSKYDYVGFTEHLPDLWANMCADFEWPPAELPWLRKNLNIEIDEDPLPGDVAFHTGLDTELVKAARLAFRADGTRRSASS